MLNHKKQRETNNIQNVPSSNANTNAYHMVVNPNDWNKNLLETILNNNNQNENNSPNNGDKQIKSALITKVNDILLSNNLSDQLFLYNMISNTNFNNMKDANNNGELNTNLSSILNKLVNNNNKPKVNNNNSVNRNISGYVNNNLVGNNIQNQNNLPSNNTPKQSEKEEGVEKYLNNEVIRCTIENFCKFLFQNGYCIVKNPKATENNSVVVNNSNNVFQNILQNNIAFDGNNSVNFNNSNNLNQSEASQSGAADDGDSEKKLRTKEIFNCPHTDRKHYAKNMCNNCYHKQGRVKKAWLCSHTNRPHYARGKCQNCYLNFYHKEQVSKRKDKKHDGTIKEEDKNISDSLSNNGGNDANNLTGER